MSFAIMACKRCEVWGSLEDLAPILVHIDGEEEPRTEGAYCEKCLAARTAEIKPPSRILEVGEMRRVAE